MNRKCCNPHCDRPTLHPNVVSGYCTACKHMYDKGRKSVGDTSYGGRQVCAWCGK